MLNPNWSRWIFASLSTHFDSLREEIPFFIEGQIRPTDVSNFAELRMDGPFFTQLSSTYWEIAILPSILIQIVQDDDLHKLDRYIGIFASAFRNTIEIFQYGDDDLFLDCLFIQGQIRVDKFGQTQAATRVAQATIEANYKMRLTNGGN